MFSQVIDWHKTKHPKYTLGNQPNEFSRQYLINLCESILRPVSQQFGDVTVTYGFTSTDLYRYLQKNSPKNTAAEIDQHASMEHNSKGNRICKRDGAACDFLVEGYENRMAEVARYITAELHYDRLYFYGNDKPIHVSIGPDNSRYALIRETRPDGLRVNKKSGTGDNANALFL